MNLHTATSYTEDTKQIPRLLRSSRLWPPGLLTGTCVAPLRSYAEDRRSFQKQKGPAITP